MFCGYTLTKYTTLPDNSGKEHCPTSDGFSLPEICCAKLAQAVKSKQPCDPQVDVNCDGKPNADDADPLNPSAGGVPQDYIWVDSPSGQAIVLDCDGHQITFVNGTRLKTTGYAPRGAGAGGDIAYFFGDACFAIESEFVSCEPPANSSTSTQSGPAPSTSPTPGSTPASPTGGASGSTSGTPTQTNSRASISGKITSKDGTRLFDVRVLLSGSMNTETRTDASGNYSFDNLVANGSSSYRVRPVRSDSNFNPPLRIFNPLSQNQTANFIASGGAAETVAAQSGSSYELKPNPQLKGQTGQLVFSFTDKDALGAVTIAPGDKFVFVGSEVPLPPGAYDITVNGALLRAVPIQQGMDTSIKIGVLNLSVAADIYDQTKARELYFLTPGKIALPVGAYNLKINGVFKPVVIRDKQVTDF